LHGDARVFGTDVFSGAISQSGVRRDGASTNLLHPNRRADGNTVLRATNETSITVKSPDEIAAGVEAAFAKGELPRRDEVSFAYMWSAQQNLVSGVGHWHPHVTDDAGTPFSVVVIPVDDKLAVGGAMK
jgi:hypothetical protein